MAPSRTRFGVLYFGVTLAVIQYIDRVCIAQAMPDSSPTAQTANRFSK